MEYRDQEMSLINRPDERRREEARIARASQARPLVEPESTQIFHVDSTFNRVTVPKSQVDDFTKTVMAVLGPYHSVLGGPYINGPRPARSSEFASIGSRAGIEKASNVGVEEELDGVAGSRVLSSNSGLQLPQLNHKHSSSSASSAVKPLGNVSSSGGDSKRPTSLPLSHPTPAAPSSSVTPSKPVKATLLTPVDPISSSSLTTSSSHQAVVTASTSPVISVQSPAKSAASKDKQMTSRNLDAHRDVNRQKSSSWTPPAPSLAVKHKTASASFRSPKKNTHHQQQIPPHSHGYSKYRPKPSIQQSATSGAAEDRHPATSPTSHSDMPDTIPSVSIKDHINNSSNTTTLTGNSSSPALNTPVTSSLLTTPNISKPSPSVSSASISYISPSAQVKSELSPPRPRSSFSNRTHVSTSPRPRSTTPTKAKPHPLNGVISQYPKVAPMTNLSSPAEPSSSVANTKSLITTSSPSMASSSSTKMDKIKSLSLWIPNQKKLPETKSDLIDILKEMTELQPPLTAIETPKKADGEFAFYKGKSPGEKPVLKDLIAGSLKQESKKTSAEGKTDTLKAIKKEGTPQKEGKTVISVHSSVPMLHTFDATNEVKVEDKHFAEPEDHKDLDIVVPDDLVREAADAGTFGASGSISQTSRYRSIGKTMTDDNSILMRDLDLSEDSDVEQTSEEINVSESQSKKGKVMSSPADAPLKRTVSRMSSSSSNSSSSGSSSDSGGDDDGDDDGNDVKKRRAKDVAVELKKASERRLSSSSSSTSSSSDPVSDDDEYDGDEKEAGGKKPVDIEDVKTAVERGEKTPSPASKTSMIASVSLGTPTTMAQESSETSLSWRLEHFMQPRNKSNSPASVSPFKSASPPLSQSVSAASVQLKDDSITPAPDLIRPRTLRDVGQCETMSFELQPQKISEHDGEDNLADEEDDDEDEHDMFKRKSRTATSSKKIPEPSLVVKSGEYSKRPDHKKNESDVTADSGRKSASKEAQMNANATPVAQKFIDPLRKELVSRQSSSNSSRKDKDKIVSPVSTANPDKLKTPSPLTKGRPVRPGALKTPSALIKGRHVRPGSGSSSNDEIDVVSYTPDEKSQNRPVPSPDKTLNNKRCMLELSKNLFNGALSEGSDDDSKTYPPEGKNTEGDNIKRYKRTGQFGEHTSSMTNLMSTSVSIESSIVSPLGASSKNSKKDNAVALGHLEAISKPPNLLSPLHSSYSSPTVASTKPLPPFQASFSPLHPSNTSMPPYVTLTRSADGTSRPKIMVQIRKSSLSKKLLSWVKEKSDRRRKHLRDVKVSEPSKYNSPLKESRLASISDTKPSQRNSVNKKDSDFMDTQRNETQLVSPPSSHSLSTKVSKSGRHKAVEISSVAFDNTTLPNSNSKMAQNNKPSRKEAQPSNLSSSMLEQHTSAVTPTKNSSSSVDLSTTAAHTAATTSSQTKTTDSPSSSSPTVVPSKCSSASAVKNLNFTGDRDLNLDETKPDKTKPFKRKQDIVDESSSKKNKSDSAIEKGSNPAPATISKRRDSANSTSSKGSHQSASSKKSRHISSISNKKDINSNNNSLEKVNTHVTNGPENSNLPFNHYVNGTTSSNGSLTSRAQPPSSSSSSLSSLSVMPANVPPPSPIETQLHSTKHYLARATEHKHHADNLKDKLAKYEPYLRSGLSFFLAGYSMELNKREQTTSYSMYNDTSNLLQYVIRMRANSSSNPESSDRERKLIVLIIRLQAYLNHRMYRLRRSEVSKLKKVIESEQTKYQSSSTSAVTTSSTTNANAAVTSKPHAPSPHQTSWNKNSTGTPSPMSPTPSPAGSVSSQGSCELVTGKIQNGTNSSSSTPLTSPSPGMVSVHQRVHAVTQKYFILTSHMVKALELWDQAEVESKGFEEFFTILDNSCGPLVFHSDPPVLVRYMKHALRLLNL